MKTEKNLLLKILKKKIFKAFTLVELIVVIVILAILGTLAFIAMEGYSKSARNSTRLADLDVIKKSLELHIIKTGVYPLPTDGTETTYSGAEVWTQGVVGKSVVDVVDGLRDTKELVDPLTSLPYTYSRLNTGKEYEIAAVMEGEIAMNNDINLVNKTYAADQLATAYVKGTYNGVLAKVNISGTTYSLAVPTIISGDLTLTDILELQSGDRMVYHGKNNLPDNYKNSQFKIDGGGFEFNPSNIVAYIGTIDSLKETSNQITLLKNLQDIYSGTEVVLLDDTIEDIVNITIDENSPSDEVKLLASVVIKDSINPGVSVYSTNSNTTDLSRIFSNGNLYTSNWNSNPCTNQDIKTIELSAGTDTIPENLSENTIYRLSAGNYTTSRTINMADCSAIIGNGEVNITNSVDLDYNIKSNYVDNIIINGINIGGTDYAGSRCIGLEHSSNSTLDNVDSHNCQYGIRTNYGNYNSFMNIKSYENISYGMYLYNNNYYNSIKNIITYNNGDCGFALWNNNNENIIRNIITYNNDALGIKIGHTYANNNNAIFNLHSYNNGDIFRGGIQMSCSSENNALVNIISYNNGRSGLSICSDTNNIFKNVYTYNHNYFCGVALAGNVNYPLIDFYAYNNIYGFRSYNGTLSSKYYQNFKVFDNTTDFYIDSGGFSTGSTSEQIAIDLSLSTGSLDTSGSFSEDWVIKPSTTGWNYTTSGRQTGLIFDGTETYIYGSNIGKQTRPIKYNTSTSKFEYYGTDGVDYNSSKYIGQW